jgi:hypothetical protein
MQRILSIFMITILLFVPSLVAMKHAASPEQDIRESINFVFQNNTDEKFVLCEDLIVIGACGTSNGISLDINPHKSTLPFPMDLPKDNKKKPSPNNYSYYLSIVRPHRDDHKLVGIDLVCYKHLLHAGINTRNLRQLKLEVANESGSYDIKTVYNSGIDKKAKKNLISDSLLFKITLQKNPSSEKYICPIVDFCRELKHKD